MMHLLIISPEKCIFNGDVDLINVPGKKGMFTILPNHAAIISTLSKGYVNYRIATENKKILINSGIVEVNKNKVTICIEKAK